MKRRTVLGMIAAAAVVLAGCGGASGSDDTTKITKSARPAVESAAKSDQESLSVLSSGDEGYLDAQLGASRVTGLRIQKIKPGVAVVRGEVQTTVTVTPKPDKASLLRPEAVPAKTALMVTRPFLAGAQKQQDKWVVPPPGAGVQLSSAQAPAAVSPAEQEQARQFVVKAVQSLLTSNGDRAAYDQAQGSFYATKTAEQASFTQPDFDPAPTLGKQPLRRYGENFGDAWVRTSDGGKDDLPLSNVFAFPENERSPGWSSGCGDPFKLRTLRPRAVSGQVDQSNVSTGVLSEYVSVTGDANVDAGDWTCVPRLGSSHPPTPVGPRRLSIGYQASVRRFQGSGGQHPWFITTLKLRHAPGGLAPATGGVLYTLVPGESGIAP